MCLGSLTWGYFQSSQDNFLALLGTVGVLVRKLSRQWAFKPLDDLWMKMLATGGLLTEVIVGRPVLKRTPLIVQFGE
jgi:hypothetical protein